MASIHSVSARHAAAVYSKVSRYSVSNSTAKQCTFINSKQYHHFYSVCFIRDNSGIKHAVEFTEEL